jgi:hypothetical protein
VACGSAHKDGYQETNRRADRAHRPRQHGDERVDLVATAYGLLLEFDEHGDGEPTGVPLGVRTPAGWMSCRMTLAEIASRWVPAHVWRAAL